jgi:alkylation response protein AidB-like acyl-CoA dehydrogenase
MSQYHAPLREMHFVLTELAGLDQVASLPGFEDATRDTAAAILDEAAKFATNVLDPLNVAGDRQGSRRQDDGSVITPPGFKDAYRQFCENGWNGLTKSTDYGGQGLPHLLGTAVEEMWHSSNLAFNLCAMLTQGAIEAIELRGSPELKDRYLEKMVAGTWAGTMNLTESQAGSDLAAVRTRAVPQGDGTYKLFGQKIFITYGEHDYTENIIHMVLARTPDAPEGVKGISLFLVPKVLVNADGSLGARNDVHCVSLEHKLGIHASPTAVMAYGDHGGAVGYLVGEENRGLEYMFIMMNLARFSVGMEGVGIAERAYQRAAAYARDRVQGKAVGTDRGAAAGPIIEHPDIRRMLMTMRAQTEAMRAVAYVTAAAMDNARRNPDAKAREQHQAFVDFMIPIVKGCSTETGQEVASLGVQVTAAWASSKRPVRPSSTATRGSRRSTRAQPASRPTISSAARQRATGARWRAPWRPKWKRSRRTSACMPIRTSRRSARDSWRASRPSARQPNGSCPPTAQNRAQRMLSPCPISSCGDSSPAAGNSPAARSQQRATSRKAMATSHSSPRRFRRRAFTPRRSCRRPRDLRSR